MDTPPSFGKSRSVLSASEDATLGQAYQSFLSAGLLGSYCNMSIRSSKMKCRTARRIRIPCLTIQYICKFRINMFS